jgi:hypothetical protein
MSKNKNNGNGSKSPTQRTKPRPVDLLGDPEAFEAVLLGALGRSTKFIQSRTTFTPSQIAIRLKRGNVRRMDYRNGVSPVAALVEEMAMSKVKKFIRSELFVHGGLRIEDGAVGALLAA